MPQSDAMKAATCAETIDINIWELAIPFEDGTTYVPRRTFLPTGITEKGLKQNWNPAVVWATDKMFHFISPGANSPEAHVPTTPVCDIDLNPVNETAWKLAFESGLAAKGLSEFGVTLHMLADTFSHQNYYGLPWVGNAPNSFKGLPFDESDKLSIDALWEVGLTDGHGTILHLPDSPTLKYQWERADESKELVVRDNWKEWQKAIKFLYSYARWYLNGCKTEALEVMPDVAFNSFVEFYTKNTELYSGKEFKQSWFDTLIVAIGDGSFIDLNGNPIKDEIPPYNEIDIWWDCFQASSTKPEDPTSKPTPAIYASEIELYNDAPFNYECFIKTDMAKFWFAVDDVYSWMSNYLISVGDLMPSSRPTRPATKIEGIQPISD